MHYTVMWPLGKKDWLWQVRIKSSHFWGIQHVRTLCSYFSLYSSVMKEASYVFTKPHLQPLTPICPWMLSSMPPLPSSLPIRVTNSPGIFLQSSDYIYHFAITHFFLCMCNDRRGPIFSWHCILGSNTMPVPKKMCVKSINVIHGFALAFKKFLSIIDI